MLNLKSGFMRRAFVPHSKSTTSSSALQSTVANLEIIEQPVVEVEQQNVTVVDEKASSKKTKNKAEFLKKLEQTALTLSPQPAQVIESSIFEGGNRIIDGLDEIINDEKKQQPCLRRILITLKLIIITSMFTCIGLAILVYTDSSWLSFFHDESSPLFENKLSEIMSIPPSTVP